jgi:hypothetical protein
VQFGNEEAIAENQQFMQDFKAMRFNWTPNGIQTLRQEAFVNIWGFWTFILKNMPV